MSAIFGIVNLDGNNIIDGFEKKMIEGFKAYKLDSVKSLYSNNIFMGCGLQYITPESLIEVLPYDDETRRLIITADAIIDNRKELLEVFDIKEELHNTVTDSELILQAYVKWGQECPEYLVGDFAFAIWDKNKEELFCARDHVGKRTLYFYHDENVFAFSTLMKPLFNVIDKVELNERWAADFLAIDSILHEVECNETIYKEIYQLPPATSVVVTSTGIHKKTYWEPLKEVKPLKFKTDSEYNEAFKKVFFEAVHCRLRCSGEVGIMLSGGLDSGSVGCLAAKKLQESGKNLKAYSSVPALEVKNEDSYYITNESRYVEEILKTYKNIEINYCKCVGKNSVNNIDGFVQTLEQPYKTIENLFWFDEILELAAKDGCRVLLDGQYGNCTISFGDFMTNALTLFRDMRYVKLYKEINAYSKLRNVRRYKVAKALLKVFVPYNLKNLMKKRKERVDRYINSPVNPVLSNKWNIDKRIKELGLNEGIIRYYDLYEKRKDIVNPIAFSHIGALETKLSLTHGIIKRDPTRDKRVVEFCVSIPTEQFVSNGQGRYLIRRAMKGILPDMIRLNYTRRGLQSADWIERLENSWDSIKTELESYFTKKEIKKYIDVDKVRQRLSNINNLSEDEKRFSIRFILITLVFSHFIDDFYSNLDNRNTDRETATTYHK